MAGWWSITNRSNAGAAATASLAAPTNAVTTGLCSRIRGLQASLSGGSAGADVLQISDGATVIWNLDLAVAANSTASVNLSDLDIRSTPGNTLTIAFSAGVASDREDVNAQGDFVPLGYPVGRP
jgi:hypothetical protein